MHKTELLVVLELSASHLIIFVGSAYSTILSEADRMSDYALHVNLSC